MPAYAHEVQLAREYGCRFVYPGGAAAHRRPRRASRRIELQKMRLGAPDASGRRKPEPVPGELVTLAVRHGDSRRRGRSTHLALLERLPGVQLDRGRVVVDERTMQTSNPRYFAGGDCVLGRTGSGQRGGGGQARGGGDRAIHRALARTRAHDGGGSWLI